MLSAGDTMCTRCVLGSILTWSVLVPHTAVHPRSGCSQKVAGALCAKNTHSPPSLSSAHTHPSISRQHTHLYLLPLWFALDWTGRELCTNGMADFNSCCLAGVPSIQNALFSKLAITWTAQNKKQIVMWQHQNQQPPYVPKSSWKEGQGLVPHWIPQTRLSSVL